MSSNFPLTVLVILDGFGVGPETRGNAIALASTPHLDLWMNQYPVFTLVAAGEVVGLPYGEVGNSEVGHMSIGSGTIPQQSLQRINEAIRDGSFISNERLQKAFTRVKERNSTLHLVGLLSSSGVHGLDKHVFALLEAAREGGVANIVIHAILDGRDAPPQSAEQLMQGLLTKLREVGIGRVGTLSGRFYAMDRDKRWDRTENAYRAIVDAQGARARDAMTAIEQSYARRVYDEEFEPTVIGDYSGMHDGDSVITWNFRPDRMRQLTESFVNNGFGAFMVTPLNLQIITMTEYDPSVRVSGVMYPSVRMEESLAKVLSDNQIPQVHIAETEKYAHVTYFFNGGREQPYPLEDRVLIPSPLVPRYDQQPEMSAPEVCDAALSAIEREQYRFIVVNFANADMVGHTGNLEATIRAVETLDAALGKIADAAFRHNGTVLITADHGNAEHMIDAHTGTINKEHTTNPVPLYVMGAAFEGRGKGLRDLSQSTPVGVLADLAPTILELYGITPPASMRGNSLLPLLR